jgi:hypothetical protein
LAFDLAHQVFGRSGVGVVVDEHAGAGGGEALRDRLADARTGAGDKSPEAVQWAMHFPPRVTSTAEAIDAPRGFKVPAPALQILAERLPKNLDIRCPDGTDSAWLNEASREV